MKTLLALFLLLANLAIAGPIIVIVHGDEDFQGLPGLTGLRPHGSDHRCLTLQTFGPSNKQLTMNIELLNIGDAPWEPITIRPGRLRRSAIARYPDLPDLFRIELFDDQGVQVVSELKPGHWINWDAVGAEFSPPRAYSLSNPGISPGRAAVPLNPFLSGMGVQVGHLKAGVYVVRVTLDPLSAYLPGQSQSVDFRIRLAAYQLAILQ